MIMNSSSAANSNLNPSTSMKKIELEIDTEAEKKGCHQSKKSQDDEHQDFVIYISNLMHSNESIQNANICRVPDYVRAEEPKIYVPQLLGFGPYHHLQANLAEMQMYKVVAAKRIHNFHGGFDFNKLTQIVKSKKIINSIRDSYPLNAHMGMDDDYLACMLSIDCLVLYELLVSHMDLHLMEAPTSTANHTSTDDVYNDVHNLAMAGRAFVQTTALRDLMMLENQIPFQAFKLIVACELFYKVSEDHDDKKMFIVHEEQEYDCFMKIIGPMLLKIFQLISPFNFEFDFDKGIKQVEEFINKLKDSHHSLDFMYNMILYFHFRELINETRKPKPALDDAAAAANVDQKKSNKHIMSLIRSFNNSFMSPWKKDETSQDDNLFSKPPVAAPPAPPQTSTNHLGEQIGEKVKNISLGKLEGKAANTIKSLGAKVAKEAPNAMLSIAKFTYDAPYNLLPSASKLVLKGGLKFKPVRNLIDMKFDKKAHTIYLPTLKLNSVTEAIIKNLVMYENYLKSGALQSQTRELILTMSRGSPDDSSESNSDHPVIQIGPLMSIMDALLLNVDDVKVLKKAGILTMDSSIPRDQVLTIFNGVSSSVALSQDKTGFYRSFIEQTTSYYENSCNVKARRRVYKFTVTSYKYSIFLSLIVIVLLTTLQTFCSVSDCHRTFRFL